MEERDYHRMPEFELHSLLKSSTVSIQDTNCRGSCRSMSPEESTKTTQLIFPYRGVFVRHLGRDQVVAEASQVLFFNADEGYRVSHPVAGGDRSLTLVIEESQLRERYRLIVCIEVLELHFVQVACGLTPAPRRWSRACVTAYIERSRSLWKLRPSRWLWSDELSARAGRMQRVLRLAARSWQIGRSS